METYVILLILLTFGLIAFLLSKRKDDEDLKGQVTNDYNRQRSEDPTGSNTTTYGEGEGDDDGDDDEETPDDGIPSVSIPISSGSFEGVNCNGSVGLCAVAKAAGTGDFGVYAERVNSKIINIVIDRSRVDSKEEKKINGNPVPRGTGKGIAVVANDITVDRKIANELKLDRNFLSIAKGTYPMSYNDKKITIKINLLPLKN